MNSCPNLQIFNIVSNSTSVQNFQLQQKPSCLNTLAKPDEFVKNPDNAEVALKADNKKKTHKKAFLIAGLTLAGFTTAASYALFKKNFCPANFEENIKFIKASTMDEAKEYAKKHFKVKEFDFGDDVEFANWVNEGLTNINNRFKGKAHMPKILSFVKDSSLSDDATRGLAITNGFNQSICFDKKSLTKEALLKDFLNKTDAIFERTNDGKVRIKTALVSMDLKKGKELGAIWDKADKARNNADLISRFDLLTGAFKYEDYASIYLNPSGVMYEILDNEKIMKVFKKKGVKLDLDAFLKLDNTKQIKYIKDKCNEANILYLNLPGSKRGNTQFDVLNHEMGHLQHYGTRNLFDDIFGKLSKKSVDKFKTDKNSQKIAGKISWYAKADPLEFVAETFNAMMSGVKMSDDVMDLYKFYKGPVIPNM